MVHLSVLHLDVSSGQSSMIKFGEMFLGKDIVTALFSLLVIGVFISVLSLYFVDADNWLASNNIVTPAHIKPE